MKHTALFAFTACATLAALGLAAHAQSPAAPPILSGKFDFDTDSVGTGPSPTNVQTTFTDTSGDIVATFSTPADANRGGFHVGYFGASNPGGTSGNVLVTGSTPFTPLTIAFDHTLGQVSLRFVIGDNATFTVQELLNNVVVGTVVSTNPFGTLSFGGTSFNSLLLSGTATGFAVDNISVSSAPEPSQFVAFVVGILGLGALALKAKRRAA